jgi:hypothetical protein
MVKDTIRSVRLLWTKDRPVAETCTWQHTTLSSDRQPRSQRDSNPQTHESSGRRPLGHWNRRISYLRGIIHGPDETSVETLRLPFSLFTCYIRRWHFLHHRACEMHNSTAQTDTYNSTDISSSRDGDEENFRLLLRKSYIILVSKQCHIPQHDYAVWIRII